MVKITEELKKKILNDPLLNTEETIREARKLIADINTAELNFFSEREEGKIYPSLLSDRELAEIQNPLPGSNLEKAVRVISNNGISLVNLIDYEKSKREAQKNKSWEIKERMLNSLAEWTVFGGTEGIVANGKESGIRPGDINRDDYQEIKRDITGLIKQNASEWSIKKILVSTGKGMYGYKQEDILLVHQSFMVRYDEYGQLVINHGKVHWKSGFATELWNEIEQSINQFQQSQQLEQPKSPWFPFRGFGSKC